MEGDIKTFIFHVHGMHCKSCVLLVEEGLKEVPYVSSVKAHLKNRTVEVSGYFGDASAEEMATQLTPAIEMHGYMLAVEKQIYEKKWSDFKIAIPIAIGFAVLFVLLQKAGLVNLIRANNVSYGTAFVIGIIASLSTCMAVVGGLVLSMSASFAKEGQKVRPQILFHVGRLVSFLILGGVIGAIGSAFQLNTTSSFVLSLVIGLVMLVMGLNLLEVFHITKKLQPAMPKFISRHTLKLSQANHVLTPLIVGVATFFLPCGFTQSMQIYTLSTGTFMTGAMTMFAFALGTLPVLALVSFSSFSIRDSKKSGVFFKSAGLIVILFALFNIINSLAVIGLIPPLFNF